MNLKRPALLAFALTFAAAVFAADKLAIAEPVGKGGMKTEDIEAFWGILEASVKSDEYKLISRGALKQMLTEIGLTASSDLVNLNSAQKAKLGRLEGVKYILVAEIGKFGTKLNCTMKILDASTGEIDQARTHNLRCSDLDDLADKIEPALEDMLSRQKAGYGSEEVRVAMLAPRPAYRPHDTKSYINANGFRCQTYTLSHKDIMLDFNAGVKSAIVKQNIRLQYFTALDKFLRKQNLDSIGEMDSYAYQKLGRELRVTYLIVVTIPRFEITVGEKYIAESGAVSKIYMTDIECLVEVRNVEKKGDVVYQEIFADKQDLRRSVDRAALRNWTVDDCGKYAIFSLIQNQIVPWLGNIKEFKSK